MKGRDHAWHVSIGFNAEGKKEKHEVYMCELENDERKGPGKETTKKESRQHDKLVGIVWFGDIDDDEYAPAIAKKGHL